MAKAIAIQFDLSFDFTNVRLTIQYAVLPEGNETFTSFTSGNDVIITPEMTDVDINLAIEQGATQVLTALPLEQQEGLTISQIIYTPFILKTL